MELPNDASQQDLASYTELLSNHPLFSLIPARDLNLLISQCTKTTVQSGEIIVREGDLIDAVYFIIHGKCEVQQQVKVDQSVIDQPIATLGKEDTIGLSELGLYSKTGTRTATVKALSDLMLLRLDVYKLENFFKNLPNSSEILSHQLEMLLRMHFIKSVAPFTSLSNADILHIADKITEISFSANETIFKQGDPGNASYVISSGKVGIYIEAADGSESEACELSANAVFGESALILNAPRNATAVATEPTTLLKIDQALFKEIVQDKTNAADALMNLQFSRSRPTKLANIEVFTQNKEDGSTVTVLRNSLLGKYHQLSEESAFIYELLDGESSINDIVLQYFLNYKEFNPKAISTFLINLYNGGFIHLDLNERIITSNEKIPLWLNAINKLRNIMEYRVAFGNADDWLSKVYTNFAWLFFTRPAHVCWLFIAVVGFIAFAACFSSSIDTLAVSQHKQGLFIFSLFLTLLTIPLHELAHAFTTKYYGRKVYCFGIGWLWLGPFAFCDTSDMWLSSSGKRVAVDLSGLYLNIILAGLAGLMALLFSSTYPTLTVILELFALLSYLFVITNLSPVIELDGYYALMDYLEKPNLRLHAVKWLISLFRHKETNDNKTGRLNLKTNRKEAIYWLAVLMFIIVNNILVPYVVFTFLLHGLFGVRSPWFSIGMVMVIVFITSMSVYKDILKSVRSS